MIKEDPQNCELEHYTGWQMFGIITGCVVLALLFWAGLCAALFLLADIVEYIIINLM